MPIISSRYKAPKYLFNNHLQTIVPNALRRVKPLPYQRQRIELPDGDFLDLDWLRQDSDKVLVISHGLEGNSRRPYVLGMANYFNSRGWNVLAWNCRSCGGELNRLPRLYHHGDTHDLRHIVDELLMGKFAKIAFTGFSMGGSITLKYLGEEGLSLSPEITRAAVFSVPCNLGDSARSLSLPENALYRKRFMKKLFIKLEEKAHRYPEMPIDLSRRKGIRSFPEFDTCFTAPLHGFTDSEDFYRQSSSEAYLQGIRVPTLLVNALNDPMLPASCFPKEIARHHPFLYLESPKQGGHVGFLQKWGSATYAEERAWEFITKP